MLSSSSVISISFLSYFSRKLNVDREIWSDVFGVRRGSQREFGFNAENRAQSPRNCRKWSVLITFGFRFISRNRCSGIAGIWFLFAPWVFLSSSYVPRCKHLFDCWLSELTCRVGGVVLSSTSIAIAAILLKREKKQRYIAFSSFPNNTPLSYLCLARSLEPWFSMQPCSMMSFL